MITKTILLAFLALSLSAEIIIVPKKSIVSVYDGDTFKINLPCQIATVCKDIPVRISGIDTAEVTSKDTHEKELAVKAKTFTGTFLSLSNTDIKLDCGRDKYFRLNCSVATDRGDLAAELIRIKLAKPYDGGAKNTDWGGY